MIEKIELALSLGKVKGARVLLTQEYLKKDKAEWLATKREEYEKDVDYSEDESYVSFDEWLNETVVVTEAIEEVSFVDEDGIVNVTTGASPEVTEQVRPYTPQDTTDRVEAYIRKATTPTVVTMRQARLALLQSELLATVDSAIASSDDEALKIEWEYATDVRRDWSSFVALSKVLGMDSEQLDDLFILAGSL